jgi:hypothetical protein
MPKEDIMKNKIVFPTIILILASLACRALTPSPVREDVTISTQEAASQPTTFVTPAEIPTQEEIPNIESTESMNADYFLTDDAYNVVNNENGSLEFYTNLSFGEIEDYYRQELPLLGYSEIFVDGPRPVEGCEEMFFDGDPSGKTLSIMVCIIFQTEEHWVSVGLVDK